ncbi:MAG: hypothetical protein M1826_007611 [Phylliscum demangeonii]|nr:MAG: hypothetical protein M1826_007611 [Phylliscum demangeonii]
MLELLGVLPQTLRISEAGGESAAADANGIREDGGAAVDEVRANGGWTAEEEREWKDIECARLAMSFFAKSVRAHADAPAKQETDVVDPARAVASQPRLPRGVKRERQEVVDLTSD